MEGHIATQSRMDMLIYGYKILLKNPNVIAAFVLTESISVIVQIILITSILSVLSYYKAFNIIPYIIEELKKGNINVLFEPIVLNPIHVMVTIIVPVTLIVISLISAFIYSGLYPFLDVTLRRGSSTLHELFLNAFQKWKKTAKIYLAMYLLIVAPLVPGIIVLGLVLNGILPLEILRMGLGFLILGACSMALIYLSLLFMPIAAILEDKGVLESIRESLILVKRGLKDVVIYVLLLVLIFTITSTILLVSKYFSITLNSIISTVFMLILNPVLTLYLISIYEVLNNRKVLLPIESNISLLFRFLRQINKLLKVSINAFLKRNTVLYILLSLVLFIMGYAYGGYLVSEDVKELIVKSGIITPGRVNPEFMAYNRLFLSLDIFFHNWKAVLGSSIAGFAYAIPPIVSLIFNGLIIGSVTAIIGLRPSIELFLTTMPHGLIEIPAFIVVCTFGIKLGLTVYNYTRGKANLNDVVNAYKELLGILLLSTILFLIAGIIEANITPLLITT